ncbi:MAG TPA: hypothetical protein VF181_04680 [Balneolaceae bacterium]
MGTNRIFLLALSLFLIAGCASIPKEAPVLSQEIGERVAVMERAHLRLVHEYFELKRKRVNRIFEQEWIPAYAKSFFSQPQVSSYWNKLVSEDDKAARLQFLTGLGPRMLKEIRDSRAEFMQPLNELETTIENNLHYNYLQILSANNTLTSFLMSSSKVAENRQRYLDMLGVEQAEIGVYIDAIDKKTQQIMEAITKAN